MSEQQGRRRVVITGVGAITPCGLDVEESWRTRLTSAEMAISAYSAMIITAVEDTTDCRLDFAHRSVAHTPMNSVSIQVTICSNRASSNT